jgi:predicted  nucleic acid-binding Zn-ribbon protein
MKEIEILKQLQQTDSEIFHIKQALAEKPEKISVLETEYENKTSALKSLEDQLKQTQIKHKEKELDLKSKEDSVNKHKQQLPMVKTNKEYNALQVEIEKMKADNSLLEEEIIILLEKIDSLKNSIQKEKTVLAEEEKKVNQVKKEIDLDIKELNGKLDQLNAQRKRVIGEDLKPEILDLYDRIRQNRGELAIVPVKEGNCSGCYMGVRAQVINELRMGKLLTCDTCSRILYVEETDD